MSFLQMSIFGAIMIVVVIIIRVLAINRLPKKTFIVLWGIVLLRLLVPFSVPSPLSAYTFMNKHIPTPQGNTGLVFPVSPIGLPTTSDVVLQGQTIASISPYTIVWGIGMIACVLFFAISYFKCHREFQQSLPVNNDFLAIWTSEHKLIRAIEIRQSNRISAPLTYGIFKPIILMPKNTNWDNIKQIEYILAHEFVHVRRFDVAIKLFLTAALCIHWFNPLVWVMYVLSNRDIELSCDEAVVHSFGDTTKSAYALTLISMEEKKSGLVPFYNSFSKNSIEERIRAIMKYKKTSSITFALAVVLVVGVTTSFATSAEKTSTRIHPSYVQMSSNGNLKANWQPLTTTTYTLVNGKMGEHDIPVGETAIYTPVNTEGLFLKEGDKRTILLTIVDRGFDYGQSLNIGYILNGNRTQLFEGQIKKDTKVVLNAPLDGNYSFYVECVSSDPLLVEMVDVGIDISKEKGDLSEQMDLIAQYSAFGVSFNATNDMFYNGELVRYFCDGVELDTSAWSIRYQYLNEKGTVDVFTKRTVIDIGNDGKDPFGNLIGLEKSSQKEFEQRDLSNFSSSTQKNTDIEVNSSSVGGLTFAEIFAKYKLYGIEYKEERVGSGYGNVYFNGELVKTFIDETKNGGVFSYTSKDGGTITVQTIYDSNGNLTGIGNKQKNIVNLTMDGNSKNYQYPSSPSILPEMSDVDTTALDIMQRTGNWGYIETYLPKMTKLGIDAVVNSYNTKHLNTDEHKRAFDYYN